MSELERTGALKRVELFIRRVAMRVLALLLRTPRRPLAFPDAPRVLVVRLDPRIGNAVMLTPLLSSLRARFPSAQIDVLVCARNVRFFRELPEVDHVFVFEKSLTFFRRGIAELRCRSYSVAIDASNPTDPSLTHAVCTTLVRAEQTIGSDACGYGVFYSLPVAQPERVMHEIDRRLALLDPLPGMEVVRRTSFPASDDTLAKCIEAESSPFIVLNVGSRLVEKQVSVTQYAGLVRNLLTRANVVLTWGPDERELVFEVSTRCPDARVAPSSDIFQLAGLFRSARAVVSCDTGPAHIAVAVGAPTLTLFVATDAARYGYSTPPHATLNVKQNDTLLGEAVLGWVDRVIQFN